MTLWAGVDPAVLSERGKRTTTTKTTELTSGLTVPISAAAAAAIRLALENDEEAPYFMVGASKLTKKQHGALQAFEDAVYRRSSRNHDYVPIAEVLAAQNDALDLGVPRNLLFRAAKRAKGKEHQEFEARAGMERRR